jgi:biopolymer transport protein ExbD
MAGSQDPNENPVAINVVPMVDVIFCLCVFFMCSFKFKQIEGKFDSWLPKNKGLGEMAPGDVIQEIRVAMFWDEANQQTLRQLGSRKIKNDEELQSLIRQGFDDAVRTGQADIPVTVDADARVPWKDVMNVVNLCKREKIEKIEFAFGAGK